MNQVVLITGGGRGIGRATALAFAAQGAKVVIASRTAKELNATAKDIKAQGGIVLPIVADVSSKTSVMNLVRVATKKFGAIDMLINNAGVLEPIAPFWKAPHKAWRHNLLINVDGVFLCANAVIPSMMARKRGVIINISSGAARGGRYGWSAYSASKAAVDALTRTMANELKEYGIVVNAVYPGIAETKMQQTIRATKAEQMGGGAQSFRERFERGENAPPEYPAKLMVWLAQQTDITGQVLDINDPAVRAKAGL
jgi:NAD(P)-dependent dehydrogenase (short-subunit alcohol dehydrogenase family)